MQSLLKILKILPVLFIITPILFWIAGFIIFVGSVSAMVEPKKIEHTDTIIVLTGGTNRVGSALNLLSAGKAKDLLISGVHKDVKLKEVLYLWGHKDKAPPCCITLGFNAGNTLENAKEARDWILKNNAHSARLITANYHMPRASLEFHHAIPNLEIIAHPIIPENFSPSKQKFWQLNFLEYHKLLMSLVRVLFFPMEDTPIPKELRS